MKRTISIAALCMTATLAFAQDAPRQPPEGGPGIDRIALLLDLDAGQKAAVEKIFQEQRAEMMAQHKAAKASGERPSREQMKATFEAKHAETVEKLRPVLSDLQLKKFEALTDHPHGPPHGFGKQSDKTSAQ